MAGASTIRRRLPAERLRPLEGTVCRGCEGVKTLGGTGRISGVGEAGADVFASSTFCFGITGAGGGVSTRRNTDLPDKFCDSRVESGLRITPDRGGSLATGAGVGADSVFDITFSVVFSEGPADELSTGDCFGGVLIIVLFIKTILSVH
jgi:hypothetical protein